MTDEFASPDQPTATPMPPQTEAQPPTSGKAITSLVLGILSLPSCFCVGILAILLGTGAVIFGILAKKDVTEGLAGGASSGLAIGGIISGIVGICLGLVYVVLVIIGMLAEAGSSSSPYGP